MESIFLIGLECQFYQFVDMTSSETLSLSRFQSPLLKTRGDAISLTGKGFRATPPIVWPSLYRMMLPQHLELPEPLDLQWREISHTYSLAGPKWCPHT